MIIARITSGLGNQLFQYAAGLALARTHDVPLRLDSSWFRRRMHREKHERFALAPYASDVPEASAFELCHVRGLGRSPAGKLQALLLRRALTFAGRSPAAGSIRRVSDGDFSFDPAFFSHGPEAYLDGNWQSEKYFAPVAIEMRTRLRSYLPASSRIVALADEIAAAPSAFVHVRRGDYVSNPHFTQEIGPVGAGYFGRALERLAQTAGNCRLFAFSDDPAWASRNLPGSTRVLGPGDVASAHDVLWLMARCDHSIMANSSLSWWAAWRDWHPGKFVCAPRPWFANSWRNTKDLLPAEWLVLDRTP